MSNINSNQKFRELFKSVKLRLKEQSTLDDKLKKDIDELLINIITAIELGNGDEAFVGLFIPKMNRYYDYRMPAMAQIGMRNSTPSMGFNPFLLFTICEDYNDVKSIITHEVYHLIFKHLLPQRSYPDHSRCNIAMDCAINQHIDFSKHLSENIVTLDNFNKMYKCNAEPLREFEYYYGFIPETKEDETLKQMLKQLRDLQDQLDGSNGGMSAPGTPNSDTESNSSGGGGGQGQSDDNDNNNSNSGGKSKEELEKEIEKLKEKILQYIKDNYIIGQTQNNSSSTRSGEMSLADQLTLQELIEGTLSNAKERGLIPGGISGQINDLYFKDPIIPWTKEFRNIIGSVPCPYRKTMRVKNRRQPKRADILGRVNDRKVKIALAIDTSGSVSDNELRYFFNEIFNIIKDVKSEVTLIQCDSSVCSVEKIEDKRAVAKVKVNGRGGTCFEPVFKYIHDDIKKMDRPDVVVYFTDGYGERDIDPQYKYSGLSILWVITDLRNELSVKTPEYIGKVRYLNIEGKKYR